MISWSPRRELSIADWVRQGHWLGSIGRASAWWIGDWLRYGNARYGDRYTVAARITGYDAQSLMNMAYVAGRFDNSRRRTSLSFSHHAEVAALPAQEQDVWLDRAESCEMSVRTLRSKLRHAKRALSAGTALRTPTSGLELKCPVCGHSFHAPPDEVRVRKPVSTLAGHAD